MGSYTFSRLPAGGVVGPPADGASASALKGTSVSPLEADEATRKDHHSGDKGGSSDALSAAAADSVAKESKQDPQTPDSVAEHPKHPSGAKGDSDVSFVEAVSSKLGELEDTTSSTKKVGLFQKRPKRRGNKQDGPNSAEQAGDSMDNTDQDSSFVEQQHEFFQFLKKDSFEDVMVIELFTDLPQVLSNLDVIKSQLKIQSEEDFTHPGTGTEQKRLVISMKSLEDAG